MAFEPLQRTDYPDRDENTHTDRDHFRDFRDYHLPLARMHHAHLHAWGIARGLEVRGALGSDTVVVQPGVAVDEQGQLIVLTQEVSLLTRNLPTSVLYVTLKFAEVSVPDGRLAQAPEVRLQTVSAVEGGSAGVLVVLALVDTDGGGRVAALKERDGGRRFRRQLLGGQFEAVEIQRSVQVDDRLAAVPSGTIAAGESGGLRITVPGAGDAVVVGRADGGPAAQVELRAVNVVMPGTLGIGTTQPREKLEVNGNITISNAALSKAGRMGIDDRGLWLEPSEANSGIRLNANPALVGLYIRGTDGYLGVGTLNPQAKLEIISGFDTEVIRFGHSTVDYHSISTSFHGSTPSFNYLGFNVEYNSNDSRRVLTLRGDGRVGIVTTSPSRPLGIRASGRSEELIAFENPTGATKWHINQNLGGANAGLNFVETGVADGRLFIRAGGNVGIGTTTPRYTLEVNGSAGRPGGGMWTDSSDLRLKRNVQTLQGALKKLLRLRGVRYRWLNPEIHGNLIGEQMGFVAQEVEEVFPEWVSTNADGFKDLTVRGLEALIVEAFRELNNRIKVLELKEKT